MKNFSYSQALLALAITILAYSLIKVANELPAIVTTINESRVTVDKVAVKIPDILSEVAAIRAEVALVRQVVDKQVPAILTQVELTRPIVDKVIIESQHYSQQIPVFLQQLAEIQQNVTQLQQLMPDILTRIDAIVLMTNSSQQEMAKWRPIMGDYLTAITQLQGDVPQYLARVENIVIDAKTVGKEASSGLVTGFFKGVISLPFEVVSGLTGIVDSKSKSAKYLTAQDVTLMQEQVIVLLNDTKQKKALWKNVDSGNRGTIVKGKKSTRNKQDCYNLTFENYFKQDHEALKELMCKASDGLWKVI